MGAITAFFPLAALITLSIALNSDIVGRFADEWDTKPALWAWLALLPAIIGGQIGAKNGSGGVQIAIASVGRVAMFGFYFGAAAFHVYTGLPSRSHDRKAAPKTRLTTALPSWSDAVPSRNPQDGWSPGWFAYGRLTNQTEPPIWKPS